MIFGFCRVELDGVPPGNDQSQEFGALVERSVKSTASPAFGPVVEALKLTTGIGGGVGPAAGAPKIVLVVLRLRFSIGF